MLQEDIHLRDYLRIMKKRQWVIITFFVVVVVSVTIFSYLSTPIYRGTSRIVIEKETPNVLSFKEVLALDSSDLDYYQTQYTILKSRTLAKRVLQKFGKFDQMMQTTSSFSIQGAIRGALEFIGLRKPLSENAKALAKEQQLIDDFLNNVITVEPLKGSRLVDISADSANPEESARIANMLIELYVEQNFEAKLFASKNAVSWLATQLEDMQKKVADSEAALQQYKEQHEIISFEDRQNIVLQKLSELNSAVSDARIKRISVESQYKQIQDYLSSTQEESSAAVLQKLESLSLVINNPLIQNLKVELAQLEGQLSELSKQFRGKHPTVVALRSQIDSAHKRIDAEIRQIVTSIENEFELAVAQEKELTAALDEQKREALQLDQKGITYGVLEREVESNKRVYEALLQRTKETTVTEKLETSNIRIVDYASVPAYPIAPRKSLNIFLSMIAGLVIGTALAFFFEYIDNSIKTPDDIKQYLDMPFLGFIPRVPGEANTSQHAKNQTADTIVAIDPKSTVSESYRSLRTNVMFSSLEHGPIILVTSAGPTEGKSITVANLAITMAQSGSKTLIIDCDLRKPRMHKIFNIASSDAGLTDMIANWGMNGHKITVRRTKIPNLDIIPCGKIPPNPSELLSSERTKKLIDALAKKYDKILIDSPPVNVVTDPVILSQIVGGVILVIRAGEAGRDIVKRAREQLRSVNANILGGVLNSVDIQKDHYYYYSYYHNYEYYREKEDTDETAKAKEKA